MCLIALLGYMGHLKGSSYANITTTTIPIQAPTTAVTKKAITKICYVVHIQKHISASGRARNVVLISSILTNLVWIIVAQLYTVMHCSHDWS